MSQSQPSSLQPQPQNEPQQPPARPPARRIGFSWQWLAIGLIAGIIIGYAVHTPGGAQSTRAAITPTSTQALKWATVRTFTGNAGERTSVFTVPDDWKIVWSCDPKSFQSSHANLNVSVYGPPNGALVNVAVSAVCKPGETSGSTEEHVGGRVFLVIEGRGNWRLQVQEGLLHTSMP